MIDERLLQAADNNARWCDVVCRTHGTPGNFLGDIWINHHGTPRFYPNAVTLTGANGRDAQVAAIQALIDAHALDDWAVKDSFSILDLSPLAFQPLFAAQWIWRSPDLPPPHAPADVVWSVVTGPDELTAWEQAWNGPADDAPAPRVFLPALLREDGVAVFAGYREHQIVAGAIANRTGNVVGVSNVFGPSDKSADVWAGCIAAVCAAFPALPLVGYEGDSDLPYAVGVSFDAIGPLRIWGYSAER